MTCLNSTESCRPCRPCIRMGALKFSLWDCSLRPRAERMPTRMPASCLFDCCTRRSFAVPRLRSPLLVRIDYAPQAHRESGSMTAAGWQVDHKRALALARYPRLPSRTRLLSGPEVEACKQKWPETITDKYSLLVPMHGAIPMHAWYSPTHRTWPSTLAGQPPPCLAALVSSQSGYRQWPSVPAQTRLFYGCSYRFHLSGDNSRDRYIKGS